MSGPVSAPAQMLVCTTCAVDDSFLKRAQAHMGVAHVRPVECMSGCANAQTVAFRSAGKTAYLFGDITAADLPELENFAKLYEASEDGTFADARVLGALRNKALARIPQ